MTGTMLIAIALLASAGVIAARAFALPRSRAAQQLAQIDAYGFFSTGDDPSVADAPENRGLIETLGARALGRLGNERIAGVRKQLLAAGMYTTSVEKVVGLWALSIVGIAALGYLAMGSPLAVVGGAALGWLGPRTLLARRVRLRLEVIDRDIPELVDLLVVGVEAGMGFNGAMRAASTRIKGPLATELQLMLREQSLGASTIESLKNMLERADTPAAGSFVRTIVQGERLGVSIGHMMRALAGEMRKRRKALAEERAQKAPIKILFPLVLLIFPSLFIVLMTPAVTNISQTLGGF